MSDYSKNTLMQYIKSKPGDIEICDVTLRDGEQTPGVAFSKEEKIAIAEKLDSIGIEVIEAGFPVVSKAEEATVREIAHLGLDARICCLARSVAKDVDVALKCDVDFVSIFIATSDLHLKYKYHKTF
ncbi:MAG: homoaconitate hydratase, partial [Candidatus Methanoperedens sp.]|nr:homoaconitate hydratase [Candidatus Methanoperedens sp.]